MGRVANYEYLCRYEQGGGQFTDRKEEGEGVNMGRIRVTIKE